MTVKRRSLLLGLGALTLGAMLPSCRSQAKPTLHLQILANSMPVQLFSQFQRQLKSPVELDVVPQPQLAELYDLLLQQKEAQGDRSGGLPGWVPFVGAKAPPTAIDLLTLGDYWLTEAIAQGLIAPFDVAELKGLQQLDAPFQAVVKRNAQGAIDPNGNIWAAPYRWGTLMLAYRRDAFESLGWQPTDWSDLWRSELHHRISLLDSARTTIGVVLKELGRSINSDRLDREVEEQLTALHRQVKFYSSDSYLQPLSLNDTWAAVGWSTDILPLVERDRRIAAIVPASGTILTADLWVRPAGAASSSSSTSSSSTSSSSTSASSTSSSSTSASSTSSSSTRTADSAGTTEPSLVSQWIDFCWQRDTGIQLALLGSAAAPQLASLDRDQLPQTLQENDLLLPSNTILERSEFMQPLSSDAVEQYRRLWSSVRQTG
jgi:putative spermidine/putrescine transport system substrate-binding protein